MKDLDKDFGLEDGNVSDNHENKCSDYKVIDNVDVIKDGEEGVQENKESLEKESKILFAQQKNMASQEKRADKEGQDTSKEAQTDKEKGEADKKEDKGAEEVITACPLCLYNLKENGNGILPVKYFTELLAEALGVEV